MLVLVGVAFFPLSFAFYFGSIFFSVSVDTFENESTIRMSDKIDKRRTSTEGEKVDCIHVMHIHAT